MDTTSRAAKLSQASWNPVIVESVSGLVKALPRNLVYQTYHKISHAEILQALQNMWESFLIKYKLKEHINVHEGEIFFKYTLCSYIAIYWHSLRFHMLRHPDPEAVRCDRCQFWNIWTRWWWWGLLWRVDGDTGRIECGNDSCGLYW